MALREKYYTRLKGQPVTICKDQSTKPATLVFLEPNHDYPHMKDLSMMKGRKVESLMECNGFCGPKLPVITEPNPETCDATDAQ